MGRLASPWGRRAAAAAILAGVVSRVGTGPFLDGVRAVDGAALAAAVGIGVLTTVCCGWRWTVVARGHGLRLSLSAAVAAYYRSTFLNLTLPGGVVGDVHRGLRHGRAAGDLGRALRAVVWERALGQLVQVVLTVAVLLVLPSPVRPAMPLVAGGLVAAVAGLVVVGHAQRGRRWTWLRRAAGWDVGGRRGAVRAVPAIVLASAVVVLGSAGMFVVAARSAGIAAPPSRMLPLALLAMLAMVLPGVAGWGPREGGAAWVFGAAGLGAGNGVATAVVYGVMALVASLPGAVVLVAGWAPWRVAAPTAARSVAVRQRGGAADA